MTYEFECPACGARKEVIARMKDRDLIDESCPKCGEAMEQFWSRMSFRLGRSDGQETGFYFYDYGKGATWDLTPKGKFQRLVKDGVLSDPFDSVPERKNLDVEV